MATKKGQMKRLRETAPAYRARKPQSPGEALWLSFEALSPDDRNEFLTKLLEDPDMREDIGDYLVYLERANEPTRPFHEFEEELRREGLL